MARYFTFDRIPGNETTLTFNFSSNGDTFDRIVVTATGGNAEYKMQYRKATTAELVTVAIGTTFDTLVSVFVDQLYSSILITSELDSASENYLSEYGLFNFTYLSGVVVLRESPTQLHQ